MRKYKSEICEVMHHDAMADFETGVISESRMREYDEMCLVQEPKATLRRGRENMQNIPFGIYENALPGDKI